ncbi:DNA-formamidopyrimidine glycosylase [Saliniradius amylolyticus]|uniref:Formamidopyrimidine-DNA glycosylase n=1 Tax=Saliniradius amylolyticus TaxID=2183582 RepID=A0A2S2DZ54_9ALTE|nr:bifunctional DNA-formamidopyrimidine glycosylase/DNA-(apurinic or apyrimidinic site) lyase [Saliniradius amylolyticus]AWL10562.1 DNA-formamidopyrimidine glycosylase [Saliniradius amylolyticus]
MPELPEVEVSRRGISPHIKGQTIARWVIRQRQLRWPIPEAVEQSRGLRITDIRRRAKYLLLDTDAGSIILHLGMSGKLRVVDATLPAEKHDHLDLVFTNGQCLRLNDPRRFGACLWQFKDEQHELLQNLGPEPLTEDFDAGHLYLSSRNRRQAVKNFIMDNRIVVGVGNIYASEALFMAGIHPKRAAGRVGQKAYQRLTAAIKQVLAGAIEQGGTTLKDFTQADGNPGYFAQSLNVYGRKGEPCLLCGNAIQAQVIGQRNTYYCVSCQN